MKESFEARGEQFTFPDIDTERGEFERVAHTMGLDADTLMFLAKKEGTLVPLTEDLWTGFFGLDNTDSKNFGKGHWDAVRNNASESGRDSETLRITLERGEELDAPIVMKWGGLYHLISGNTRLMVARALGITPKVLLFEYKHDRTDEATD